MAKARAISVTVTGNTAPLRKSLKEADKELTAFGKAQAGWAAASAAAYGIMGSAVGKFAMDSVRAAMDDQKAQALLADQLRKTTGATSSAIKASEDFITQLMFASNVTDDQLRPALAQLVRITGDTTSAQKLLASAVDVSVGSGRDLGSVVTAVGKAVQGSTGGLQKLGITLSDGAAKSGDLNAIMAELNAKFGGAAAAAVDTTAGRIENLNVRFGELKEQIGTQLLPLVADLSEKLLDVASAAQQNDFGGLVKSSKNLAVELYNLANPTDDIANWIKGLAPWSKDASAGIHDLAVTFNDLFVAASFDLSKAGQNIKASVDVKPIDNFYMRWSNLLTLQKAASDKAAAAKEEQQKKATDQEKNQTKAAKANREAYQATAKTLREDLGRALEDSRKNLEDAKKAAKDFGDQFAYSFGVSLAGAYSDAKDSENAYSDALKGRKDAYDALDVAKQGNDLNAYLKAIQDVKTAEEGVTAAQAARVTPAAAFQKQIADAKTFGANLKTLIGDPYKLGQAGLQQLLDLGPTAGASITSDLIAGTAGFSVGDLNRSLADLATVQAGLSGAATAALAPQLNAAAAAAQSQVDALSSASIGAPGVGQGFVLNVNTGVGDPVAIGAAVKDVLGQYNQRAGKLTVQGPKKKAKR